MSENLTDEQRAQADALRDYISYCTVSGRLTTVKLSEEEKRILGLRLKELRPV